MKQTGNIGNGERPETHEPRRGEPTLRVTEVAWHNGKNASATGAKAIRERRARRQITTETGSDPA